MKPLAEKEYAYYEGDTFVAMGTAAELAEMLGLTMRQIASYASPSRVKQNSGSKRGRICVRVDED